MRITGVAVAQLASRNHISSSFIWEWAFVFHLLTAAVNRLCQTCCVSFGYSSRWRFEEPGGTLYVGGYARAYSSMQHTFPYP
jgi:hypothetical protein